MVLPHWVSRIADNRAFVVPVAFISLIAVILVPLSPIVADLLISANLALAAIVLLTTIYVERPIDFSVFPSLLLISTLFRLVLNIATTRLILTADAESPQDAGVVAGKVIEAFSAFVAGDVLIVGLILFVILVIVQFIVVTKGTTRISEVAARFMLDGMPGKQMAIDADLNAGLITEEQARIRRNEISQEADFYGAMDGASKFVRGDAIAGIIITFVNIVGGLAVGVFDKGWGLSDSLNVFTRLTIGDGLVSQIPSFVISIAAGLIVTRSSGRTDLGTDLMSQLMRYWRVPAITAGFLVFMAFTGLPATPMVSLALILGSISWLVYNSNQRREATADADEVTKQSKPSQLPVEQMLNIDTLELEVGYGLVRLLDTSQGGDLLDRITMIRRQLAGELGLVMPPVRIRDNMQLPSNQYHIKIRANSVAEGSIYPGSFLAMDSGLVARDAALPGTKTREPAFGLDATWIDAGQKQRAEALNYTVVDAVSVLATHLTEVVKNHAYELLTREETNNLITQLREKAPKLVDEVLGPAAGGSGSAESGLVKPGDLQKVLQNLLRERVPIRDLETIVETLGDWAPRTKDIEVLTEYARNALRRTICNQYVQTVTDGEGEGSVTVKLYCVSLDPALEDQIASFIDRTAEGTTMSMPPAVANRITTAIIAELQRLINAGHPPVVLASPQVRSQVRRLLEPHLMAVAVLGYNEVSKGVEVESMGLVQLESNPPPKGEAAPPELQGVMN